MDKILIVVTTFSDREEAVRLAKELLKNKLVACAQLSGKTESFYWWNDTIENDTEYILTLKTSDTMYSQLEIFLKENHSYETPEILALPVMHAVSDYHNWLLSELGKKQK